MKNNNQLFVKKVVAMTLVIGMVVGMTACSTKDKDLMNMMNSGEKIEIVLSDIDLYGTPQGTANAKSDWVVLESNTQHSENNFREEFESIFNITKVSEMGIDGKSGVMYIDEAGDRNSNSTLMYALRNQKFAERYMADGNVITSVADLAIEKEVYKDLVGLAPGSMTGFYAGVNAYYGLVDDYSEPDYFNATTPVTRKDFYAFNFRATTPVDNNMPPNTEFLDLMGISGEDITPNDMMASHVQGIGYVNMANGGMTADLYNSPITKLEAVYYLMNSGYGEKLVGLELDGTELKDMMGGSGYENFGNRLGLVEKEVDQKTVHGWQEYALSSMLSNPKKGYDMEVYKAVYLALELGIIDENYVRGLGQPINREELLQLYFNFGFSMNDIFGYLSLEEYGAHNINKFTERVTTDEVGEVGTGYASGGMTVTDGEGNELTGDGSIVGEDGTVNKMDQAAFEAEFGEELTYVAKDTSMTVEDRKSLINEMGKMFSCDVSKYIEMVNGGTGSGTGSGTGQGGTTTTTPPPATTPPATTPPATTPPATTPPATTPPKTTPPATTPPKTTPTPGAGTGGNTGGTDTEGKTREEIESGYDGWNLPRGEGGSTTHPDDKLS